MIMILLLQTPQVFSNFRGNSCSITGILSYHYYNRKKQGSYPVFVPSPKLSQRVFHQFAHHAAIRFAFDFRHQLPHHAPHVFNALRPALRNGLGH